MSTLPESKIIDGVEIHHTWRGHHKDIEVYTYQSGPKTYSLFKRKGEDQWRCDWAASYQIQKIELDANAGDEEAMLSAFVKMLKETTGA